MSELIPEAYYNELKQDGALEVTIKTLCPEDQEGDGFQDAIYFASQVKFKAHQEVPGFHHQKDVYYSWVTGEYIRLKDKKVLNDPMWQQAMVPDFVGARACFRVRLLFQLVSTIVADIRDELGLKPPGEAKTACRVCMTKEMKRMTCSRCKSCYYCSASCQKKDWKR